MAIQSAFPEMQFFVGRWYALSHRERVFTSSRIRTAEKISGEPCFPTYKQLFINKWHTIHTKVNIKVKNKEDLNNAVQRSVGPRNVNELTRKAVCSDLPHTPQQLKSVSFTLTELCKEGGWNAS
jgi:hypothetical protein